MIINKQKPIQFNNNCGCLVDESALRDAILWRIYKPVAATKNIFIHGKYPAISVYGKKLHIHRVLMEYWLGRSLWRREYVHHKDGNRLNALRSNLETILDCNHQSLHNKGRKFTDSHKAKLREANKKRKDIKMPQRKIVPHEELKDLLMAKRSINSIAKHFNCDWSTIKNRIYANPELVEARNV